MKRRDAIQERARAFVRNHGPPCPACGYSLLGNTSGVCPECGKAYDAVALAHVGGDVPLAEFVTGATGHRVYAVAGLIVGGRHRWLDRGRGVTGAELAILALEVAALGRWLVWLWRLGSGCRPSWVRRSSVTPGVAWVLLGVLAIALVARWWG